MSLVAGRSPPPMCHKGEAKRNARATFGVASAKVYSP